MKHFVMVLCAAFMFSRLAAAAEPIGELRAIDCQEGLEFDVPAKPGDILQFSFSGGVYPGGMIDNVKVTIDGKSVEKLGVVFVPEFSETGERLLGGIKISAFFAVKGKAHSLLKLTPTGEDVEPKTYKIRIVPQP
ncbi:hypothetical protein SH661x_004510 [Planctomicrobium sp. SH661]|uniref:hypothetical protein n=1 Tax=Planctomicrobium sp. SH661 TaxID=3448124 RepID=UPI003F5BC7D9